MTKAKTTILVVDDEEPVRELLQQIMEDAGYNTVTAANGREALDKLSYVDVSLVLLDIVMPDLNGFQTLDMIRRKYDVPVIILTGKREVITLQHALAIGADDFVGKPFRAQELLARIEAKLRRAKK
jgi:DNA-binding response OmpR family regulator